MSIVLLLIAAALVWAGVDALLLSRHEVRLTRLQKDELMFGKNTGHEITDSQRRFAERRYPVASNGVMKLYGGVFIALGLALGGWALGMWG